MVSTIALALVYAASACAQAKPRPAAAPRPARPEAFTAALEAIRAGDLSRLLALRDETTDSRMGRFLVELYERYGKVERVAPIAYESGLDVTRGVFFAAHENGPFLWDMISDGVHYPMLTGTNELRPYLVPAAPPPEAMGLANATIAALNRGDAAAVFPDLICNCLTAAAFEEQVATLTRAAGEERARDFIRGETIPGFEDQLFLLHFLSRREALRLGFHFTLWKRGGAWKINALHWTQEELLPPPEPPTLPRRRGEP